mmetsp:Transcript_4717/g.8359  ORF Transcript_4717/g.8359 Transcript_4717/m.8359 type:complete len:1668 (+) Transcript_4717:195-5198(+)
MARRVARQGSYAEDEHLDPELVRELSAVAPAREEPLIERLVARRPVGGGVGGDSAAQEDSVAVVASSGAAGAASGAEEGGEEEEGEAAEVEYEYLVKWRGKSYLHVEWVEEDVVMSDVGGSSKLKRFVQLAEQEENDAVLRGKDLSKEEYFDPSFVQVERILDASHDQREAALAQKKAAAELQANGGARAGQQVQSDKWRMDALQLLGQLESYTFRGEIPAVYFSEPVDEELHAAPGYYSIITQPMDFSTIRQRLVSYTYTSEEQFVHDVRLVFENCAKYNGDPELHVRKCGDKLAAVFEKRLAALHKARIKTEKMERGNSPMFLVKWKGLSYADATWEYVDDILDDTAIAAYYRRNQIPTRAKQVLQAQAEQNAKRLQEQQKRQQQLLEERRQKFMQQQQLQQQQQQQQQQQYMEHQNGQDVQMQRPGHPQQFPIQSNQSGVSNPAAYAGVPYHQIPQNPQQQQQQTINGHVNFEQAQQPRDMQQLQMNTQNQQLGMVQQQMQPVQIAPPTQQQQLPHATQPQISAPLVQQNDTSTKVESDVEEKRPVAPIPKQQGVKLVKYDKSPIYKNGLSLRSYQLEGLNWLAFNHAQGRGCILADEMGLGKTCQTVSFVDHLHKHGNSLKPCLVVAPLSTLGHWKNEFERWSGLNAVLYHDQGTRRMTGAQTRELIRRYEFHYWRTTTKSRERKIVPGLIKFDVLITSYEALVQDGAALSSVPFEAVIVDEGHRLKTQKGKLAMTFRDLIKADMRVILTGTPLQNNVGELYNLLHFVEPKMFNDSTAFLDQFGDMQNAEQVTLLQQRVRPFMLRRLKEHVEKDIPAKEETVIDVELTMLQKKYYRAIFERNREFLSGGVGVAGSRKTLPPQLTNIEMELRKCCNHPFLVHGVEAREMTAPPQGEQGLDDVIQASGKMVLLDKLLAKLRKEGHKVLIFSQFKMMLDIIQDYCTHPARQYPVERIDGNVSGNARQKSIDRYCDPRSNSFVFLLSTRAGGVGINLTAADTVVIFDSDWNPQNDLQAMARCHRIGQKNSVMVYRFVTKNTYEAHLFDCAARKLGLEQAVLGKRGGNDSNGNGTDGKKTANGPQSREEIEELLRFGAYRLLENDDEAAEKAKQYSSANIDDLLMRNSRKVNWDAKSKEQAAAAISFSKASFVAAGTDQEVDVSDPSFWTKVLGADPRSTLMARLEDGSVVETEEQKKSFFDELRAAGNQVIAEKLSGNVKPDFEDQVIGCLTQITNMNRTFNEKEQAAAVHFLKQVERPSRRHYEQSTEIARFYDDEEIDGLAESAKEKEARSRRKRRGDGSGADSGSDEGDGADADYRTHRGQGKREKRQCEVNGQQMDMSMVQKAWIEPERLMQAIKDAGGYRQVVNFRQWNRVRDALGLQPSNSVNFSLHRVFKKYFAKSNPEMFNLEASESEDDEDVEIDDDGEDSSEEGNTRPKRRKSTASASASRPRRRRAPRAKPKPEPVIEMLDPEVYEQRTKEELPWCRYCGAVESSGWSRSPWGPKMLCIVHYVEWFQKKTLDLSEYEGGDAPEQPLNPGVNTQFKYLAWRKEKEEKLRQEHDEDASSTEIKEMDALEAFNEDDVEDENEDDEDDGVGRKTRSRRKSTGRNTPAKRKSLASSATKRSRRKVTESDSEEHEDAEEVADDIDISTSGKTGRRRSGRLRY